PVTVGSTVYSEFHRAVTKADGTYSVSDLPVGPITFAVTDPNGNVTYAANQIRTPGEQITQDLVFQKKDAAGFGTVRVVVRRSDIKDATTGEYAIVPGAHVGASSKGYGLVDAFTASNGRFELPQIPAG